MLPRAIFYGIVSKFVLKSVLNIHVCKLHLSTAISSNLTSIEQGDNKPKFFIPVSYLVFKIPACVGLD